MASGSEVSTPNLQFPTPKNFSTDRLNNFGRWELEVIAIAAP